MKKYLYFFILLSILFTDNLYSQKTEDLIPSDMKGIFSGTLEIYKDNILQDEIPMILAVDQATIERGISWVTTFGEGEEVSIRPYSVRTINAALGHFEMDEHNGIVLHMQKVGNQYYSNFHVDKSLLEAVYTFSNRSTIIFEIKMYHQDVNYTTGDNDFEGDRIPAVKSFPLQVYQKAVLKAME